MQEPPTDAPPDTKELSVKQRNLEFHRLIASGLSKAEAKRRLGYNQKTMVRIHQDLLYELEKVGITEKRVARKFKEGLDAKTSDGGPDHKARANYLKMISTIKGYEMPAQLGRAIGLTQFNFIGDEEKVRRAIALIEAELKAKSAVQERYAAEAGAIIDEPGTGAGDTIIDAIPGTAPVSGTNTADSAADSADKAA